MQSDSTSIRIGEARDGTVTYLVDLPPEALPQVSGRDIECAWEAARQAASTAAWGVGRLFRFRRADGSVTDLALSDPDACCWAGAVDGMVGIGTSRGLSICLRLLALVDLLARARWTAGLIGFSPDGADLHPALLRAAATARLTPEARFDESGFRATLAALPGPAGAC